MPSFAVHCKLSEIRTGKKFEDLHRWMDAPHEDLGVDHRTERHAYTRADEQFVRQKWGEKAVVEWLFHIAIDNLDTAFKKAKTVYGGDRAYNFFRFGIASDNFVYIDSEALDDDQLQDEFEDVYDEN